MPYYNWIFGQVITAARLNAPWDAAGNLDLDYATLPKSAGQAATPLVAAYLDNGLVDGGSVYFNAGVLSYLQSNAAGLTLTVGGFTTIDFAAATAVDFNAATLSGISDLGTVVTADINAGTWQGTIDGNWTAAGQTCADLGIVTTVDINAGTIDNATIGATVATTGVFTTLLCGANANFVDFANAQGIFSQADSGVTALINPIGVVGEATATLNVADGTGLYGIGLTNGAACGFGVRGYGKVTLGGDTGIAFGVSGSSTDAHAGGDNVSFYAWAANGDDNIALQCVNGVIKLNNNGIAADTTNIDANSFYVSAVDFSAGNTQLDLYAEGTSLAVSAGTASTHKLGFLYNNVQYYFLLSNV